MLLLLPLFFFSPCNSSDYNLSDRPGPWRWPQTLSEPEPQTHFQSYPQRTVGGAKKRDLWCCREMWPELKKTFSLIGVGGQNRGSSQLISSFAVVIRLHRRKWPSHLQSSLLLNLVSDLVHLRDVGNSCRDR